MIFDQQYSVLSSSPTFRFLGLLLQSAGEVRLARFILRGPWAQLLARGQGSFKQYRPQSIDTRFRVIYSVVQTCCSHGASPGAPIFLTMISTFSGIQDKYATRCTPRCRGPDAPSSSHRTLGTTAQAHKKFGCGQICACNIKPVAPLLKGLGVVLRPCGHPQDRRRFCHVLSKWTRDSLASRMKIIRCRRVSGAGFLKDMWVLLGD